MATAEVSPLLPFVGEPAACLAIPQTQKARGIVALSQFDLHSRVPTFHVYPANRVHPSQLVGFFARPCPMRPRHGFVDSRVVSTVEEGVSLIHETLTADPEAEIVTMPHVAAEFSGIWTPGFLIIGKGTDGATSGSSAFTIPALGDLTSQHPNLKTAAGIEGTPYLELLWPEADSLPLKVQLRDGPPLPQSLDYIPKETYVTEIIRAEGDLLAWEAKMRSVPPGAIVYHPNGSLASHYAIHAVLNQVPLLISHEPAIGDQILPDAGSDGAREIDMEALRAGYSLALRARINKYPAALIMLAGCHHIAAWKGRQDGFLGLALGFSYRLAVTAALGEIRHVGRKDRGIDRELLYSACWNKTHHSRVRARFRRALYEFLEEDLWRRGFGGRRWFEFTRWAAVIHNRMAASNGQGSLEALNQLVHGVHNGGWGFNKFLRDELLDETAANPVTTLAECAPALYQLAGILQCHRSELAQKQPLPADTIEFPQDFAVHEVYADDRDRSRRSEW